MPNYFTKSRVEAFSDGIFAIIITLLILEIKVPHIVIHESIGELAESLYELTPKFIAWVISFLTVAVIWVNHHRIFERVKNINNAVFWLNANLLLWVSFIPFPTALMGDYPNNKLAVSFFGLSSLMMGIAFTIFRVYMWKNPEITIDFTKEELWQEVRNVLLFGPLLYILGAATAWIHPYIAFAFYALVTIYFIFPKSTAFEKTSD
ncbi:MAG: TMEM175 family protein [Actinomycetota bacterium]